MDLPTERRRLAGSLVVLTALLVAVAASVVAGMISIGAAPTVAVVVLGVPNVGIPLVAAGVVQEWPFHPDGPIGSVDFDWYRVRRLLVVLPALVPVHVAVAADPLVGWRLTALDAPAAVLLGRYAVLVVVALGLHSLQWHAWMLLSLPPFWVLGRILRPVVDVRTRSIARSRYGGSNSDSDSSEDPTSTSRRQAGAVGESNSDSDSGEDPTASVGSSADRSGGGVGPRMERLGPTPRVEPSLDCDRCDRTDVFGFRRPLSDADRPALVSEADRVESVCYHCRGEGSSRPIGSLIDDRETDGERLGNLIDDRETGGERPGNLIDDRETGGERPGDDGEAGRNDAGQG